VKTKEILEEYNRLTRQTKIHSTNRKGLVVKYECDPINVDWINQNSSGRLVGKVTRINAKTKRIRSVPKKQMIDLTVLYKQWPRSGKNESQKS
jgi:hypothetical protein